MLTGVEIKVSAEQRRWLEAFAAAAGSLKPTAWRWQEQFIASRQRGYQKIRTDH